MMFKKMMTIFISLFSIILMLSKLAYAYPSYSYEVKTIDKNVVHIITIQKNKFNIELIKAHNKLVARETVSSIAKRSRADIAINGGFFKIGHGFDGMPSGTLVINNKIFSIKDKIQPLLILHSGKLIIDDANPHQYLAKKSNSDVSIVSGIPLLINKGKIVPDILKNKGEFARRCARTAIGKRLDGSIVIIVAESGNAENNLYKDGSLGLSILGLAQLMDELGCHYAINLDGGGSSSLWLDGKIVNTIVGDEDEASPLNKERPVSDAIVFHFKK